MSPYLVTPATGPLHLDVRVPGSKSITNRALLLAALAEGDSSLSGVLFSDDTRHFIGCLESLRFQLAVDERAAVVRVHGEGGRIPAAAATLYVGSAGTAARFITAMLLLGRGRYEIDASPQMRARPMAPLLDAIASLGATVECRESPGHFPCRITATAAQGGSVQLDARQSSQFVSAMLMVGACFADGLTIQLTGKRSAQPYVHTTLQMMKQFGVAAAAADADTFVVTPGQHYRGHAYAIEPDVSSACYFYAMAMLTGGAALVRGVHRDSLQADIRFVQILESLGGSVAETADGLVVSGPPGGRFPGIEVDMNACSDQTMTLAALAPFASSPTLITNVAHLRVQESDRIHAIVTELGRMGIVCEEGADFIRITPGLPAPTLVETYDDHRMAMAFTLVGLRVPGIRIDNPACTAKTFEGFFDVLEAAR